MYLGERIYLQFTVEDQLNDIIALEKKYKQFVGQSAIRNHKQFIRLHDKIHFSVFEKDSDNLVGYILINGLDNVIESVELMRFVIDKSGIGYGKEAMQLVKRFCFEELNTLYIWLDVFSNNFRAIRLYQTMGFVVKPEECALVKYQHELRQLLVMRCYHNVLYRAI